MPFACDHAAGAAAALGGLAIGLFLLACALVIWRLFQRDEPIVSEHLDDGLPENNP